MESNFSRSMRARPPLGTLPTYLSKYTIGKGVVLYMSTISPTNKFLLKSLRIPIMSDIDSFANAMSLSRHLIYLLSTKSELYYRCFSIKKKNGETRNIMAPTYTMKTVQRWILQNVLDKLAISPCAMAFYKEKGSSTRRNAEIHQRSLYLLEYDIRRFFDSIPRKRVLKIFLNIGYNTFMANVFANICTYKGYLPQGGVCSPYLSNIVCIQLDERLQAYCAKRDILYSRYADDMTFSCDNIETLRRIKKMISKIITSEGFDINQSKTRLLTPFCHKSVTGITINDETIKANKELKK